MYFRRKSGSGWGTKPAPQPEDPSVSPEQDSAFDRRLARRYDELKGLYCGLYHGGTAAFDYFVGMLRRCWEGRKEDLREQDACREDGMSLCLDFVMNHTSQEHEWARKARAGEPGYRERYFFYDSWDIPREFEKTVPQVFSTTAPGSFTQLDNGQIVMTNFYPYQWDLNYANPVVFNDMTENLLYLANRGVDVIRLDAVPYIWKELGTTCCNLPQVHILARMLRVACEVVCPGVLLLGEVVMEPVKVAPYFGTVEKPECHMLYNATAMCTTRHTLATGDVALLKRQMEIVCALPKEFLFLNYLRCHDDIGWGLDYPWLKEHFGAGEVAHKKYLNDYFTGKWPGSGSRYGQIQSVELHPCGFAWLLRD